MRAKAILTVLLTAVILAAVVLVLPGCNALANKDNAAAARLQAEAELARAEAARESAKAEAEADRIKAKAEAEAEKERAEADRLQTEAEAYQRRQEAAMSAEAQRSAIRQAERDASYERTLGLLPFVVLIIGLVIIGGLAVLALAGRLQRRSVAMDPGVVLLLQRQDRRLQELERAAWHVVAAEQRRQLTAGPGPIVVYRPEERDQNERR
jgi:flagellar biosynthesis GTPase FlhF